MFEAFYQIVTKQQLICSGDRVAVGLSGGADSVCLLYLCHKLREKIDFTLSAAHVNHGLRDEAEEEAAFCRQLCQTWQIPFFETRVCARQPKKSVEAAARELRYGFFESLEQDKIALAHHQNDQAETVLLHLLRGCGIEGLGGMTPKRGKYIRPLLSFSRQDIEDFCQQEGLRYCTDQSNFSKDYTRNRVRLEVIPLLQTINPKAVDALCRTAELLRDDGAQLEQDTQNTGIFTPFEDGFSCDREAFFGLSPALRRRTVRACWKALTGEAADLWYHPVEAALALFEQGKTGKRVKLGKNIWAENSYHELLIAKEREFPAFSLPLQEGVPVPLPGRDVVVQLTRGVACESELCFDGARVQSPIVVRNRKEGDVIRLTHKPEKLKTLFIDRKIPRRMRDRALVFEYNGTVIGVTGLGVAQDFVGRGENCLIVKQERMKTNDESGANGGENSAD